jgi:hypothetical protein
MYEYSISTNGAFVLLVSIYINLLIDFPKKFFLLINISSKFFSKLPLKITYPKRTSSLGLITIFSPPKF